MLICFVKLNDTRYLLISEFKKKTYQLSVIFYLGVNPRRKIGFGLFALSFYFKEANSASKAQKSWLL